MILDIDESFLIVHLRKLIRFGRRLQSRHRTVLGSGEFGAAAFEQHGFLRPYAQA
jgi:hypothetical protein